jgi:hypothetical protein
MNIEQRLLSNFEYIQNRIEEIKAQSSLDIKQISDLHRYVEMQKHIIESLYLLREEGKR